MTEAEARGRPTEATARTLLVKACGRCSFPGCATPLVDQVTNVPTLRIAHIKARSPGGPRYDAAQSGSERHAYPNLIALCATHGDVIDKTENVAEFSVERLLAMKAAHEGSCSGTGLDASDALVEQVLALSDGGVVMSVQQKGGQTAQNIFNIGAPGMPPSIAADVELYAVGNTATEDWARWYHVGARTTTESVARDARLSVVHQRSSIVPEQWKWQGAHDVIDIRRAGTLIPLVIGGLRASSRPLSVGWYVAEGVWHMTPSANESIGRLFTTFVPEERHLFDVTVSWIEGGLERQANASFELRFWRTRNSEPRFLRVGQRPSPQDQAGGLGELRDIGVGLRNRGTGLPDGNALPGWREDVGHWSSAAESLIAEVSPSDANVFRTLDVFPAAQFPSAVIYGVEHLLELQVLHEQIARLTRFMTTGRVGFAP